MIRVEHPNDPSKDYGTPSPVSLSKIADGADVETVSGFIDGVEVTVPVGTSVMRAAAIADINIPKLCATDSVKSFGSCRLCLVQIEGRRGSPASCTTPFEDGMRVTTQNTELADIRVLLACVMFVTVMKVKTTWTR